MDNEFLKNVEEALKSFEEQAFAVSNILTQAAESEKFPTRWEVFKAEDELEKACENFHDIVGELRADIEQMRRRFLNALEELKVKGGYKEN